MDANTKKELSAMRRMGTIMEPLSPASRARVLAWLAGMYGYSPVTEPRTFAEYSPHKNYAPPSTEQAKANHVEEERTRTEERGDYRTIRKRGQTTKL